VSPQGGILPRLRSSARDFLYAAPEDLRPARRALAAAVQVVVATVRKLRRDRASQMAAALSFQTLFSLLPLLVLALIVLHSIRGLETAGADLRNMIVEFLVPESLVDPDHDLEGPPDPRRPPTVEEFNDARLVLRARIDDVLEALSGVSFAGIGAAGFLLFLYGATALMRTVEGAFNLIYQADASRPWSRLPLYFTILTLGPVALVGAQVLQSRLLERIGSWMGGWVTAPLAFATPLVVTCAVLMLAFRSLPHTWVSWRAAALGGLWSGIAWFAFQEIFGLYVNRASMTSLYGALALLPLFLLWVYSSWLIILAGLTLSFSLQYLAADETRLVRPLLPGDPRWLVPILVRIARAFDGGETVTMARLARELHLPPRVLHPYLRLLERRGLARRLSDRSGESLFTLARPMPAIRVAEILELASPPLRATDLDVDLLRELHRCELEVAGDLTLYQLVHGLGGDEREGPAPSATPPAPTATEPATRT